MKRSHFGLRFDLRLPDFSPASHRQQYAAALEMARWADKLGFGFVALSEHHGTADGYMSAPFTLAAGMLGATEHIRVNVAAALIPLHDPIRLAEQLATIDLMAPGRIGFVAGAGYRQDEFDMAGVDRSKRGALLEEYITVLRDAWSGEPFEWRGRSVVVTPRPATPGGPRLMLGGSVAASARRAARLRMSLFAAADNPEVRQIYADACAAVGFTTGTFSTVSGPAFVMVSNNVDQTWSDVGEYALFDARTYDEWQEAGSNSTVRVRSATTVDDMRGSTAYRVVTPEECVELARQNQGLTLHPLMGGIPADVAWDSLRLFEHEVLPNL